MGADDEIDLTKSYAWAEKYVRATRAPRRRVLLRRKRAASLKGCRREETHPPN
jgi:hypothetical protein